MQQKKQIIIDTDLGDDIDDTWAIMYALQCSTELDIRYIITSQGNTEKRASLLCKILSLMDRTEIDVGVGIPVSDSNYTGPGSQYDYCEEIELSQYKGKVYSDGITELINIVERYNEQYNVDSSIGDLVYISLAPLHNLSNAIDREPDIFSNCHFIGMQGNLKTRTPEFNVKCGIKEARNVLSNHHLFKSFTITPADVCGKACIEDDIYEPHFSNTSSDSTVATRVLIENISYWAKGMPGNMMARTLKKNPMAKTMSRTSSLYDPVAILLSLSIADQFITVETKCINIEENGRMVLIEPTTNTGKLIQITTAWKDMKGFINHIVTTLTSQQN
jgi:inosine-uridine nucleoside N-ribohydrolase